MTPTGRITPHFRWREARDREGNPFHDPEIADAIRYMADWLESLRHRVGFPLRISSWYRSPSHSIEAAKVARGDPPGSHATGYAVDIRYRDGAEYAALQAEAWKLGARGMGHYLTDPILHVDLAPRPARVSWVRR